MISHRYAGDLIGQKFGRLTVVAHVELDKKKGHIWKCECSCGGTAVRSTGHLRDKNINTPSCGCYVKEVMGKAHLASVMATTKCFHPLKLKMKHTYRAMVKRCCNPKYSRYWDYGGRGIRVCQEWLDDRYAFYDWCIANGIKKELQIDRIDNDGPYSPDNCKFSTQVEQQNNTRKNVRLEWGGHNLTIAEWARKLGVTYVSIQHRVDRKWTLQRIFTQPFKSGHLYRGRSV